MVKTTPPQFCPRCRGPMIPERDRHGEFSTCFTCGYVYEPESISIQDPEEERRFIKKVPQPSHGKIKL